ncbi:hypothetical protein, variant [Cladophialophora immunda]|uniref:Uncharacterized protein n=1 Tax=Cladophialophora immunda TaxID=569365 RepID=A0A0D2BXT4_9EURO|nr:uncharacterized protein PV07_12080 [Cladophialophora immunda]XP_016244135.1 hypothetical protein, variant [Cladophialophora immunda]KIW23918.1 hypothetical protein PV07_12080 [Cladophialophora immunda]KIW23919.1 hypothetical protein, variant [Cladophialophora immunda]
MLILEYSYSAATANSFATFALATLTTSALSSSQRAVQILCVLLATDKIIPWENSGLRRLPLMAAHRAHSHAWILHLPTKSPLVPPQRIATTDYSGTNLLSRKLKLNKRRHNRSQTSNRLCPRQMSPVKKERSRKAVAHLEMVPLDVWLLETMLKDV